MTSHHHSIILADFPVNEKWAFRAALEKFTGRRFSVKWVDGTASVSRLVRIIKYFFFPIKTFLKRNSYQNIVCWQQFFGIMIAFYCKILRVKRCPRIFVMTFIYRPKKGVIGKIYEKWIKYSLNSEHVARIIVYSRHEVKYYSQLLGIDINKIAYIPLGLPQPPELKEDKDLQLQNYIFSPGKSNRDFDFLVDSLRGEEYNLHIACDDYPQVDDACITVHHDVFNEKMYHYMHNCRCVVIPLKDLDVSSGQLVMLQAMQLKKPIIVSNSNAISDFVTHEVNALIINNNKEELLNALHRIYNDSALCSRLTSQGYKIFIENHSEEAMGKAMARFIVGP